MKRTTLMLGVAALAATFALSGCWWVYCDDKDDHIAGPYCEIGGICYQCDDFDDDCEPWRCGNDWECPDLAFCDDLSGVCTDGGICTSDWDCPESLYCDPARGTCTDEWTCYDQLDCAAGEICNANARCVPDGAQCNERADCLVGEICIGGQCESAPAGCTTNAQCGAGAYCDAGGICRESGLCTDSADCLDPAASLCENGSCVADPGQQVQCDNNLACAAGEQCRNGQCEVAPSLGPGETCTYDEECGIGWCVNSECHQTCFDDLDCGSGQACVTGQCWDVVTPGAMCVLDNECNLGEACINGTCFAGCSVDTDCANAEDRCVAGACVADVARDPACTTNADCIGVTECVDGVCRTPCGDDIDCIGCGYPTCQTGYCHDLGGTQCAVQGECAVGENCADAQCVPAN